MASYFDKSFYPFRCKNPKCRMGFRKVLRTLIASDEFTCRFCGTVLNIRESKATGDIRKAFDRATALDKATIQSY